MTDDQKEQIDKALLSMKPKIEEEWKMTVRYGFSLQKPSKMYFSEVDNPMIFIA